MTTIYITVMLLLVHLDLKITQLKCQYNLSLDAFCNQNDLLNLQCTGTKCT